MENPVPVLDQDMVNQWFANSAPDEQAGDRKTARMLNSNVAPRLAVLKARGNLLAPADAKNELHSLRGSIGSFGFLACAFHLTKLERNWAALSEEERQVSLAAAHDTFVAGMAQLFAQFPHLRGP